MTTTTHTPTCRYCGDAMSDRKCRATDKAHVAATSRTTRTPTPWILSTPKGDPSEGSEFQTPSLNGKGDYIGAAYTKVDAAFIVTACNAHDELVAALHEITHGIPHPIDIARAALAKCGGAS